MKNLLFVLISILILGLVNCTVNESTTSITFQNDTSVDATLIYGTNKIWAGKGSNTIIYTYQQQDNIALSINGLSLEGVYYLTQANPTYEIDTINLKFNYQYNIILKYNDGDYFLIVNPMLVGDEDDFESDDVINFE